jgi:hypothetical protein
VPLQTRWRQLSCPQLYFNCITSLREIYGHVVRGMMQASQDVSPLLRLPTEIRRLIYSFLLPHTPPADMVYGENMFILDVSFNATKFTCL